MKNELTWSKSRDAMFLECRRKYWFQYYGAWDGWEAGAEQRTREIYVLKGLKSRQMWAGQCVHAAIEHSLKRLGRSGRAVSVEADEIVARALDEMRRDFQSSRGGRYRQRPKTCALFEHEYAVAVPDDEWKRIAATVERCLRTFHGSATFEAIRASERGDWLECEEFSSFQLADTKVYVVLDFALREGNGIAIYDWKTGGSDGPDNRLQLSCYALYAHERWGVDPDRLRPVEYNLNRDVVVTHRITAEDLDRTRGHIQRSLADMRRILRDPEGNLAVEDDFPRVDDTRVCQWCKFLKTCRPDGLVNDAAPCP